MTSAKIEGGKMIKKLFPIEGLCFVFMTACFGYLVIPSLHFYFRILGTIILMMISILAIVCDLMFRMSDYLNEKLAKRVTQDGSTENSKSTP